MISLEPTPVTVLTGFLGSGKTTLLNALLRDPRLADTAVIINEFGEVGLDHLLVSQADENIVLLDSGCLCCTIGNGLTETLETLYRQRLQGSIPAFKRVVVETTGLADPFPLLKTVLADYFVSQHFAVNGVLTTVDALHGWGQFEEHREARNQTAIASHIAMTKCDVATPAQVDRLTGAVRSLNASASVSTAFLPGATANVAAAGIIDFLLRPAGADFHIAPQPAEQGGCAVEHEHDGDCGHGHGHAAHHFHHDERIESFVFHWTSPVPWQRYARWLERLRQLPAVDLMRVKGLLELDAGAPPYVIQGVQHTFATPARLPNWPTQDQRSWLVVIARGVSHAQLHTILQTD